MANAAKAIKSKHADPAEELYQEGNNLLDLCSYKAARKKFTRVIEMDPGHARAYVGRGECTAMLDDNESAIKDFDRAIALDSCFAQAYFQRGESYLLLDRNAEAMRDLDTAINLCPEYFDAYLVRAAAHIGMDMNEKAIEDCDNAFKHQNVDEEYLYILRGHAYNNTAQFSKAIMDFNRALEIGTANAKKSFLGRGYANFCLGNWDIAIDDLTKVYRSRSGQRCLLLPRLRPQSPGQVRQCNRRLQLSAPYSAGRLR